MKFMFSKAQLKRAQVDVVVVIISWLPMYSLDEVDHLFILYAESWEFPCLECKKFLIPFYNSPQKFDCKFNQLTETQMEILFIHHSTKHDRKL